MKTQPKGIITSLDNYFHRPEGLTPEGLLPREILIAMISELYIFMLYP